MNKTLLAVTLAGAALSIASPASAEPTSNSAGTAGTETLAPVKIRGRVQAPAAAIDVSRAQPKLGVAVLRQPFLDRIERVICRDPF